MTFGFWIFVAIYYNHQYTSSYYRRQTLLSIPCACVALTWRHQSRRSRSCRKASKIWADTAAGWGARSVGMDREWGVIWRFLSVNATYFPYNATWANTNLKLRIALSQYYRRRSPQWEGYAWSVSRQTGRLFYVLQPDLLLVYNI